MDILITGVSSGIGKYLTQEFENRYNITGVSRSKNIHLNIDYIKGDLRKLDTLEKISQKKYDYIIINAGIGYFDKFEDISLDENKEIIETNLLSPILLINSLLNNSGINKGIIFIGSLAGKKSMKFGASYAASKFGLRGFAMQLKNELTKLQVHLVNPKIVDSNFHKNSRIEIHGRYKETSLDDIYNCINSIITGEEKRFEVDL